MRRLRVVCWAVAAISLAVGGLLWLLPPNLRADAIAPAVQNDGASLAKAPTDTVSAMEIALANVFDTSRTPPTRRYLPPEFGVDSAAGMLESSSPDPGGMPMENGELPKLYGTVLLASGSKALLHLDASDLGPRLYSVGDRDGGYRIISITPRSVVLAASRGQLTLRLDSEEMRP